MGADSNPEVPPLPERDRAAAIWAWPLVVLSIFVIGWSVNFFQPHLIEEAEESHGPLIDASDLALLKIQSQVVIAAAVVSPGEAVNTLEQLREMGDGDRMIASIALLESFTALRGSDPVSTLSEISSDASESLVTLTTKAVKQGLDEEDRKGLAKEVGWFSKLAPATGLSSPPEAQQIRTHAMIVLLITVVLFLGAMAGVIAGGILLFLHIHRQRISGNVAAFRAEQFPRGVMLECFALYLGVMAAGELGGLLLHPNISMVCYGLAVVVPFLWPTIRGIRWKSFTRSLGFHAGQGFWREVRAGAMGYLGVIAIASVGIFLTLVLGFAVDLYDAATHPEGEGSGGVAAPETHPIVGWIFTGGWKERLLCLFLAAGFAPFFEEIFFRGALHRYLRGNFRFLASALLTGLIFASLHPQGWMGIPALAAMGLGFSLLREWRDSLIAPMVAHAINNGVLVSILSFAL